MAFSSGSDSKESACNAGDQGSSPGSERSPREGNDYPLQISCLENSMTEKPGGLQSMALQRVRYDRATNTPTNAHTHVLVTGASQTVFTFMVSFFLGKRYYFNQCACVTIIKCEYSAG